MRGDHEGERVTGDDRRRGERDAEPRVPGEQRAANVGGHGVTRPRERRRAARPQPRHEQDDDHGDDEPDRHQRHRRVDRRRQRQQDDHGEDDLHDLPGEALPGDGPEGATDLAGVVAVAQPAMDVADDAAGTVTLMKSER